MNLYAHPQLSNDFKNELALLRDADPAIRAKAREPFIWLAAHNAEQLLYSALIKFAPLLPITGLDRKPELWRAPPPTGLGDHVAIVLGLGTTGDLRCVGTNSMAMPVKPTDPIPSEFFKSFDARHNPADQVKHIHQAISAAAKPHEGWVESVCAQGQRYRTLPVFLVVLDGSKSHVYATTSQVTGPRQSNPKLSATARILK
jgi:hypothetical protein